MSLKKKIKFALNQIIVDITRAFFRTCRFFFGDEKFNNLTTRSSDPSLEYFFSK